MENKTSGPKEKLLIVFESQLGDLLMHTGIINAIRHKYIVTLAVQKELVPIAKLMGADQIISFDIRKVFNIISIISEIKQKHLIARPASLIVS